MKINYEKIVTRDLTHLVSEEQLACLKGEAKKEKNRIRYYNRNYAEPSLQTRAEERVYLASEYQKKNSIEKAILLANIIFADNTRFAEMLLSGKFDRRALESYIKLLEYLRCKRAYNLDLNETDLQYEKKCGILASKIAKHISMYIGPIKPEIIINKINEMLSFCPELLEVNEERKIR